VNRLPARPSACASRVSAPLAAETKTLTYSEVQHARAKLLESSGLNLRSRLELYAPGSAADRHSRTSLPPPEEALTFARICALSPAAAMQAAGAVAAGEGGDVNGRGLVEGILQDAEVEAGALELLRHAVAAARGDEDGAASESRAGDAGMAWQKKASQQLVVGQRDLAARVNVWISEALRKIEPRRGG
jgi:hypothetical protein